MFAALVVYIVTDIAMDYPENLVSIAGVVLYILVFYVTSVNPARVNKTLDIFPEN